MTPARPTLQSALSEAPLFGTSVSDGRTVADRIVSSAVEMPYQVVASRSAKGSSQALKMGMQPLRQAGLDKVLSGQTTVEEVLRVTQEEV